VRGRHLDVDNGHVGLVESERRIGEQQTREQRYYPLSAPLTAVAFGAAVRQHWGIENQLHWVLDMTFGEDRSRMRTGTPRRMSPCCATWG